MNNRYRKIIILFPLLIYLISVLSGCTSSKERRILVVHSYEETYVAYPDFNHLIANQFRKKGIKADIRTIYLDCESFREKPELERMKHFLDSVSGDWRPEVILVNEDQATYSLLKCGASLVKEVPVVFAGVNYPNWALIKQYPNATGFHDKINYSRNVGMAKRLFGDKVNLFTILDSTYLDMQIRADARKQLRNDKVTGFIDSLGLSLDEQFRLVREEGYIRFLSIPVRIASDQSEARLMWLLNKNYRGQCYMQLKRDFTTINIGAICVSPSMTVINEAFGYGEKLLGGYITSLPVQVEEEVEAAVRILHGTSPADIPIVESKKEYLIDWNVMKQLGIKKEGIPTDYTIVNIPFSKKYPYLYVASIVTSSILFITIVACLLWLYLREQKRKKQALYALADEKETLALAIEGGTTYAWKLQDNFFIFEDAFWRSFGMPSRKLPFTELVNFVHPDHWHNVQLSWKHLKEANKKIVQLRCDFNGEGYQWWEFRYTTNLLEGGGYKTAGLLLNIQEMKDREEELDAARLLAEKAELKQSFLANMSHEIRTPLNSIVGFSNILATDEELTSDDKQEYIDTINKNSDLLLKLVNDILELSRIESGYMSFCYKKCVVKDLVDDVYMTHQVLITPRLDFHKEEEEISLEIDVDRERLIQVLTNFLNNATKFTESGSIKIGYYYVSEEEAVHIYVEDTGRGIPREEQQMIFSRFYKQNEFSQGAGLGLSICKVIVEKLGGKITLKSEAGKGSCFTVILPCRIIYHKV